MNPLLQQAEEARKQGDRETFLRLKDEAEKQEQNEVKARHNAQLENVKKEFPIGQYVPELSASIEAITDGCGTQRGWINIKLKGREKTYTPQELRRAIFKAKENKRVNARFNSLTFPKAAQGRVFIGEYDEALDDLIKYMGLDRLTGLQEWGEVNIDCWSETYSYAMNQAKEDGFTDEQAEEKAQEAESDARSEEYNKYRDRFIQAVNYVLKYGDLELVEDKKYKFFIVPLTSWEHSAGYTATVITGYGTFEFKSGKELKDCGPYKTYSEAVIQHLHWLKKGIEVYGDRCYSNLTRY